MIALLTFIGWAIAQFSEILRAMSRKNEKFKPLYFLENTWLKLIVALFLSFSIAYGLHFIVVTDTEKTVEILGLEVNLLNFVYIAIGVAPELILQRVRKKYGYLKTND